MAELSDESPILIKLKSATQDDGAVHLVYETITDEVVTLTHSVKKVPFSETVALLMNDVHNYIIAHPGAKYGEIAEALNADLWQVIYACDKLWADGALVARVG